MKNLLKLTSFILSICMILGGFSFYCTDYSNLVYAAENIEESDSLTTKNELNEPDDNIIDEDNNTDNTELKNEIEEDKPYTPYNIKASLLSISDSQIKISWVRLGDYTKYKIYCSNKKEGEYKLLKELNGNTYTHSKLKIGTNYFYKIIPSGIMNEEIAIKNEKSYSCIPVPKAPSTVKVQNFISNSVKISWSKVSGVYGYKIYMSTDNKSYTRLTTLKNTKTSYVKTKLKNKKVYYFKVAPYKKVNGKNIISKGLVKKIVATKKSYVTVMIDPGHRGRIKGRYIDYGAIGYDLKTKEADLNDNFAIELEKQLKIAGYNVVFSRNPYKVSPYYSLKKLTDAANKKKPDLFISVHHNASLHRSTKGYSIWYSTYKRGLDSKGLYAYIYSKRYNYGRTKYKVVKEVYSSKGIKIYVRRKGKTEVVKSSQTKYYLRDSTPPKIGKQSKSLAKQTEKEFGKAKVLKRWGSKGYIDADFAVLVNTRMPSMMLEVGFISNKKELKILKKSSTRKKYSKSVVKAVNKYYGI